MKCKYKAICGFDICTEEDCEKFEPAQETVADRIRSMSDKELAKFLCDFQKGNCEECPATDFCSNGICGMNLYLKRPAEEELE